MKIELRGEKHFFSTINFFKKQQNWQDILVAASNNVAQDILVDAKQKLYQYSGGRKNTKLKKRTGGLENAVKVSVDTFDDIVDISLGSDHPAAAIIEYGGYSPFPPWGPGSNVWNYGEKGDSKISPDPWHIAMGIYKNQPFATPRPAMQNALRDGMPKLNKEIWAEAKRQKP